MGIRNLNRFLKDTCKKSIKQISLSELSGKKVAVDISIYLYKYATDNLLIENMYLMLSVFRHYNIIPIFIFDGKPPTEKTELLKKRHQDKVDAEKEYKKIENQYIESKEFFEKQELISTMDSLKKKFVYINKEQIQKIKELIELYGATYYEAEGEADELCAYLVIKKIVWGCFSEDMDLFVYGCNNVLRYLSLLNHTIVNYSMKGILNELEINQKEFREICVLSGTDYNIYSDDEKNSPNLEKTLKYFKKFNKNKENKNENFFEWLLKNTDYIQDYELLIKVYSMFEINYKKMNIIDNLKIVNKPVLFNEKMKNLLREAGFIFVE